MKDPDGLVADLFCLVSTFQQFVLADFWWSEHAKLKPHWAVLKKSTHIVYFSCLCGEVSLNPENSSWYKHATDNLQRYESQGWGTQMSVKPNSYVADLVLRQIAQIQSNSPWIKKKKRMRALFWCNESTHSENIHLNFSYYNYIRRLIKIKIVNITTSWNTIRLRVWLWEARYSLLSFTGKWKQ